MKEEDKAKLNDYIDSQRRKNVNDEIIRSNLLGAGWSEGDLAGFFTVMEKKEEVVLKQSNNEDSVEKSSEAEAGINPENKEVSDFAKSHSMVENTKSQGIDKSFFKTTLFAVLGILILGSISFTIFYVLKHDSTVKADEEEIIVKALFSHVKNEAFSSDSTISFSLSDSKEEIVSFNLDTKGYFEQGKGFQDSKIDMSIKGDFIFKEGGLSLEIDGEGEYIVVDGVQYLYVKKMPKIPFAGDLSSFEKKWISLDPSDFLNEQDLESLATDFPDENFIEMIEKEGVKALEIAQEEGFLKIEKLADKGGLYSFRLKFDPENVADFLRALDEEFLLDERYDVGLIEIIDEVERNMGLEWEEFKKGIRMDEYVIPLDIDIDKKTNQLRKISLQISFDIMNGSFLLPTGDDGLSVELNLVTSLYDFGKKKEVEKPKDPTPFEELIDEMFGLIIETPTPPSSITRDASIKSDLGQMRPQAKLYYEDSGAYKGFCLDSDYLNSGRQIMVSALMKAGVFDNESDEIVDSVLPKYCKDGDDFWIATAPLSFKGGYWCSDYTGFSNNTKTDVIDDVKQCQELVVSGEMSDSSERQMFLNEAEKEPAFVGKEKDFFVTEMIRAGAGWLDFLQREL